MKQYIESSIQSKRAEKTRGRFHVMTESTIFEKFAGIASIVGGICVFCYSISLVVLAVSLHVGLGALRLASIFLIFGSLALTLVWVAIYARLRETDSGFALWALIVGMVGHFGSLAFGGYDLAASVTGGKQPTNGAILSQTSPDGLLTFGVVGLSLLAIAWLIGRGGMFPRSLGYVGYVFAILSIYIYPARIVIQQLSHPAIAGPIILLGFILGPLFYIWIGVSLLRGAVDERVAKAAHKPDLHRRSV
jgi:hypothetical protein